MKSWLLALFSFVILESAQALEPGRYLISTTAVEIRPEGNTISKRPARGFLLTIAKDGKATLEVPSEEASDDGKKIEVETLTITGGTADSLMIQAKYFVAFMNGESPPKEVRETHLLTLSFNTNTSGSPGRGSDAEGGWMMFLEATIGRLPDK